MRTIMTSAVLVLIAVQGSAKQPRRHAEATACQGTLTECVDSCRPATPPIDCRRQYKECKKTNPGNKRRCREQAEACSCARRERQEAIRQCLKDCRDEFRHCTPSNGSDEIEACIDTTNECMSDCQQETDRCQEAATAQVQAWLGSFRDLFSYCAAQAGDDHQALLECLGDLPEIDLSCIETKATCFRTCSSELRNCLS